MHSLFVERHHCTGLLRETASPYCYHLSSIGLFILQWGICSSLCVTSELRMTSTSGVHSFGPRGVLPIDFSTKYNLVWTSRASNASAILFLNDSQTKAQLFRYWIPFVRDWSVAQALRSKLSTKPPHPCVWRQLRRWDPNSQQSLPTPVFGVSCDLPVVAFEPRKGKHERIV